MSCSVSIMSWPPDNTLAPSGEKATQVTVAAMPDEDGWLERVRMSRPVATSQSLTFASRPPEATSAPLGENATDVTEEPCGMSGKISVFEPLGAGAPSASAQPANTRAPSERLGFSVFAHG